MQISRIALEDTFVKVCHCLSLLLGSNQNVAVWIKNIFLLVGPICSTRIMGKPIFAHVTIKIIKGAAPAPIRIEHWSIVGAW